MGGIGDFLIQKDAAEVKLQCGHPSVRPGDVCGICGTTLPATELLMIDKKKIEFIKERCIHGKGQGGPAESALALIEQVVDELLCG